MRFFNPLFLILLVIVPAIALLKETLLKKGEPSLGYSTFSSMDDFKPSLRLKFRRIPLFLRYAALVLLIVAMARPQAGLTKREITSHGIDIMLVLDTSGSMQALDFQPKNRLMAAKEVIKDFISGRREDRIGLVVFSKGAFTQCPLTLDYDILLKLVDRVDFGMMEDGTAMGSAVSVAVNRLKDSKAKSKVIVLLTDGINNAGKVDPLTAAKIAASFGIKIYTIGAGKPGPAMLPINDPVFGKRVVKAEIELDEDTLTKVATETGGLYFRAKDERALKEIYERISKMEKVEIKSRTFAQYREVAPKLLAPAIMLLLLEILLINTVFKKLP